MSPTRRPSESPQLTIEVAPAYELLQSIAAAIEGDEADTYDVGPEWFRGSRQPAAANARDRSHRGRHGP